MRGSIRPPPTGVKLESPWPGLRGDREAENGELFRGEGAAQLVEGDAEVFGGGGVFRPTEVWATCLLGVYSHPPGIPKKEFV